MAGIVIEPLTYCPDRRFMEARQRIAPEIWFAAVRASVKLAERQK